MYLYEITRRGRTGRDKIYIVCIRCGCDVVCWSGASARAAVGRRTLYFLIASRSFRPRFNLIYIIAETLNNCHPHDPPLFKYTNTRIGICNNVYIYLYIGR